MRIAIFGVGGVGGYFGAQLARSGEEVAFIARGPHLEAIREYGLCVTSPSGEMLVQPSIATDDPADVGVVDAVLLGVKAEQVVDVTTHIGPLLGPDTCVVPLQNGVEAVSQLRAALGDGPVIAGLCGMMSWVAGPGHVRTLGDVNFIRFGELDNRASARTSRLRDAFEAAGVKAEIPDDIHRALWEKFLIVASLGGVGAATERTFGQIRDDAEAWRMLELAMQEIFSLARTRGIELDDGIVKRTLGFVEELPYEGTSSMQRDLADGKPSELEAWNGAVVRLASESGVDAPVNRFIYETLQPVDQAARSNIR